MRVKKGWAGWIPKTDGKTEVPRISFLIEWVSGMDG